MAATLACYVAAVVVLSWPLATVLATHLPNAGGTFVSDLYYAGWALAWQSHALLTEPARFTDANIYGGVPHALFYGPPGFGLLPAFLPVFAASDDATLSLNAALLLNLALTAAAVHVVVGRWTRSPWAAVAAGTTFLMAPAALGRCAMTPQYAALWPVAPIVWIMAQPSLTRGAAVALGVLIAVQAYTDAIYVAVPVFLVVGLSAVARGLRAGTRPEARRLAGALLLAAVAVAPLYAAYALVRADNPHLRVQSVWSARHLWVDPRTWLPLTVEPLTLDRLVGVLVLAGLLCRATVPGTDPVPWRVWRQAGAWFLVALLLGWVLPVAVPAFRALLIGTIARDVTRLGFVGLVPACLLAGLGFAACVATGRSALGRRTGTVVAVLLLGGWIVTRVASFRWPIGGYPVAAAPSSGAELIFLRSGRGTVLELPIGALHLDTESHARAMYRSTRHWRTLLNGYASYYPATFPVLVELARRAPAADALAELRRDAGLETIVLRTEPPKEGDPAKFAKLHELWLWQWRQLGIKGPVAGPRIVYEDANVMVLTLAGAGRERAAAP
jgi:hypothetical protein